MKKLPKLSMLLIACAFIVSNGCSIFINQTDLPPLPPQSANPNNVVLIPQIGTNKNVQLDESNNYTESQSKYKRRKIIEDRGRGGVINKLTVENAGNVPNYTLYPSSKNQFDTNDNPDQLSVPNWQIKW